MTINQDSAAHEFLVARQPIFDKKKDVFAYQLFFKPGIVEQQVKPRPAADDAPLMRTVDGFLLTGLNRLAEGKKTFITFSPDMLVSELPLMFPKDLLGVEVHPFPGTAKPPRKLAAAVKKVKKSGYLLMVGDDAVAGKDVSLLRMADIIGSDFRDLDLKGRAASLREQKVKKARFLAKSVESAADYEAAVAKGYEYFQGGFFNKADLVPVRNIPSHKSNLLNILKEINKPEVHFDRIEQILKKDVSITYKLLRFINSANFGIKSGVHSIRHALNLMGESEVRKWLSLIVLSGAGSDKPQELIKTTIVRAKFCETVAAAADPGDDLPGYFLVGMFSMVDAFLDRPLAEVIGELPLAPPVKAALMGEDNRYRRVLDVVTDYEHGDWRNLAHSTAKLKVEEKQLPALYMEAVEWARMF